MHTHMRLVLNAYKNLSFHSVPPRLYYVQGTLIYVIKNMRTRKMKYEQVNYDYDVSKNMFDYDYVVLC